MNTNDLEAFLAVIETGSLGAAAARLNLTQPGVTRRVQNLEQQLGVALFERQAKPLRPTEAGRDAYEHGRRVIQSIEDLRSGTAPGGAIGGELRIGISPFLSEAALADPVDRLRAAFPALAVRLTMAWSPQLQEQIGRNQIDAAALCLADGIDPPEQLTAEAIGHHSLIIVAPEALALPAEIRLADLAAQPWIINQDGCGFRHVLRRRFEAEGLAFVVGVEVPSPDLRLSLVARGIGLSIVTPSQLAASPWRGRVRIVAVPGFEPVVRAWIARRFAIGRLRAPIALFRDALREGLAAERDGSAENASGGSARASGRRAVASS